MKSAVFDNLDLVAQGVYYSLGTYHILLYLKVMKWARRLMVLEKHRTLTRFQMNTNYTLGSAALF